MEQLGCKLFRTEDFPEILVFLTLFGGKKTVDAMKTALKIEEDKSRQFKISAAEEVKVLAMGWRFLDNKLQYMQPSREFPINKYSFQNCLK